MPPEWYQEELHNVNSFSDIVTGSLLYLIWLLVPYYTSDGYRHHHYIPQNTVRVRFVFRSNHLSLK